MNFPLTDDLRQQYQTLFNGCVINPAHLGSVNAIVSRILPNQARYQSVAVPLGIPWYFVAVIHSMESGLSFNRHLHNGDPLTARTVQVPAGRPPSGDPPFTWEQSAVDALTFEGFASQTDWSLPAILYRLEKYNGFGYRNRTPPIMTPYLWSFSNQYTSGKFVADKVFDPGAVSTQCGAALILLQMRQNGMIDLGAAPAPVPIPAPLPAMTAGQLAAQFDSKVVFSATLVSDAARSLQQALNNFPGIQLREDGIAGRHTSDAYKQVTGHFLQGDTQG
jgi:lysozyme family protein